jgi:hypothetical protein
MRHFYSSNANSISGISVQGDSKGIDIDGNSINLNWLGGSGIYSALVLGPNTGEGESIQVNRNQFTQKVEKRLSIDGLQVPDDRNPSHRRYLQGSGIGCPYSSL